MPLLKHGRLVGDDWTLAGHAEELDGIDPAAPLFCTWELWQDKGEHLAARTGPLGLRLRSDQPPEAALPLLERLSAIALEFPKFTDGRPYSHARLLRERHGFTGELRAVGEVLRDQLIFMLRCGFDTFELPVDADPEAWRRAAAAFDEWYQSASDGRRPIAALRRRQQRRGAA